MNIGFSYKEMKFCIKNSPILSYFTFSTPIKKQIVMTKCKKAAKNSAASSNCEPKLFIVLNREGSDKIFQIPSSLFKLVPNLRLPIAARTDNLEEKLFYDFAAISSERKNLHANYDAAGLE